MAQHSKWVVDPDHPAGYLVPLTAAEETLFDVDQSAGAAAAAAASVASTNASTIRSTLSTRMGQIRTARTALGNGTIFNTLTANEKAVIDGLLADNLYLARLVLNIYDGTG